MGLVDQVTEAPSRRARAGGGPRWAATAARDRRRVLIGGGLFLLGLAFIVSRVVFLDRDLPPWRIAVYQPIDEFYYTISSFNLFHYGSWVHQVVPFVGDDSNPLNVLQALLTWVSLEIFGNTYWGLRMASVVVACGSFGLIGVLLWRLVPARDAAGAPAGGIGKTAVVGLWLTVAFFDFSFLMSARVAEPTSFRLFAVCGILVCCSLSYFNTAVRARRSFVLGLLTGAAVAFVYIYNAFLVPGVLAAVLAWSWHAGRRDVARHGAAFVGGAACAFAAYFGLVWWLYRVGPFGWYTLWISRFSTTSRGAGFKMVKLWSIGIGNIFRFNPGLLTVALLSLPLFVYAVWRYRSRLEIAVLSVLAFFVAQSGFVNDYPQRKMLILLPLVLAVIAAAHARLPELARRLPTIRLTLVAAAATGLAAWVAFRGHKLAAELSARGPALPDRVQIVIGASAVAVCVLLVAVSLTCRRGSRLPLAASAALLVCLIAPGAALAVTYVYGHPAYTYRQAMKAAAPDVDGQVTAGGLAYSMRLYNTSVPVLSGYLPDPAAYWREMRRLAAQHIAVGTFSYTDRKDRRRLAAAGYVLVQTYDIPLALPSMGRFGRYAVRPPK